jgi:hypothetical protein
LPRGFAANGIPRNLLTAAVAPGRAVVVPIMTPESIVAVGFEKTRPTKNDINTERSWSFIMTELKNIERFKKSSLECGD